MTPPHVRAGPRLRSAAALVLASALAACSTVTKTTSSEEEDTAYSAAPANIASLSEVAQRNPSDPQAFNMRGTVLGRGGHSHHLVCDVPPSCALRKRAAARSLDVGCNHRSLIADGEHDKI